ncbi:MAG: LPS assembly lipoprotein LptE, partial [Chitinophagaceae bacterium]
DWEINVSLDQYTPSTSAISNQTVVTNRLTVAFHVIRTARKNEDIKEYDVSRSFEFPATKSLQQAENELMDEMTRTLTDEIFNKLFSDW